MQKLYTQPKIKVNVKRPHVEFNFQNPNTGTMKRFRYYFNAKSQSIDTINRYLMNKCAELSTKLSEGFNPFIHDYESYLISKSLKNGSPNLIKAMSEVLAVKSRQQKQKGFESYQSKVGLFISWLKFVGLHEITVQECTTEVIKKYLNYRVIYNEVGLRTRFNDLTTLNTMFVSMVDEGIVIRENFSNPCDGIPRKRSASMASSARVIYTKQEVQRIKKWCKENDEQLLEFIRFITYAFMRPGTIRLLRVRMIDLKQKEFNVDAEIIKVGERERRIIQGVHLQHIEKLGLENADPEYYVFGKDGKPSDESVAEEWFRRKWRKCRKALGFPETYEMYSLRHTFATDLVRSGVPWHKIMKITGHRSLSSFEKYVRFIQAEKAEDLSDNYSISL